MQSNLAKGTLLFIAILSWAISFPVLKIVLEEIPPITLALIRFLFAIPILYLGLRMTGKSLDFRSAVRDQPWQFTIFSIGSVTAPNVLQNIGMVHTTATMAAVLQASGPIFTILLAFIFLHEFIGPLKVGGVVLAITGSLLLVTDGFTSFSGGMFIGNILLLLTAVAYSFGGISGKMLVGKYGPGRMVLVGFVLGTLLFVPFSVIELWEGGMISMELDIWLYMVFIIVFPTALSNLFWFILLKEMELSKLIFFAYLIPIFAAVVSYLMLGDIITLRFVAFASLIIAGVAIAQYARSTPEDKSPV